uniref:DUF7733 domain-containing protein n=1 Tax=Linum usitatissimum TaxID=4006 RepID=A0A172MLJ9_LINUS|nr:hypothetical protein [Linum usitatissimum]
MADNNNVPRAKSILLNPIQIFCLVISILLAGTSSVTLHHPLFVIFSAAYAYFLSKISFPLNSTPNDSVFSRSNKLLSNYVLVGGVVGLFLPAAYILLSGESVRLAAAPHLFLLASQVFMEGVSFAVGVSVPVRAFVPVFYNSRRIFSILEWIEFEFRESGGGGGILGKVLAVANLGFWGYNLFGFLLPVYLPRVFRRYYGASSTAQ